MNSVTTFKAFRISRKDNGFDLWMTERNSSEPFQEAARVEVTGMRHGTPKAMQSRLKEKADRLKEYPNLIGGIRRGRGIRITSVHIGKTMTRSEVHNQAMELAVQADMARMMGDHEEGKRLIREAFSLERLAAESAKNRLDLEPSRSVLFRSAASLALESGEAREAERLAAIGLSGNPPDEIADELRDVLERSSFQRHLKLHGYRLLEDEFQISLAGDSVASGIAPFSEVMPRADSAVRLLYRTAQRRSGRPFRDSIPAVLKKKFSPQLSMPRAQLVLQFLYGLRKAPSSSIYQAFQ